MELQKRAPSKASPYLSDRRMRSLYSWLERTLDVPGDVAECGVGAGQTSAAFLKVLQQHGSSKKVHLFDTFTGLPDLFGEADRQGASGKEQYAGNFCHGETEVRSQFKAGDAYELHKGVFSKTLPHFTIPLSFIHADADLYESTVEIIKLADRVLQPGGVLAFDDYQNPDFPGVACAVHTCVPSGVYDVAYAPQTMQAFAVKV